MLTSRAHIITALALHFAPTVDASHVLVSSMTHALKHSEMYQLVRLVSPTLLRWLIEEFDIKGEAYSTPLTCLDVASHDSGGITAMPIFLQGVSIHPLLKYIKLNTPSCSMIDFLIPPHSPTVLRSRWTSLPLLP